MDGKCFMKKIWFDLMLTFMKIGLFTFGGGYAMISLIEDNCINKKHWITEDEMVTITAIAESTPGPIAINCATYVGYKQANFIGALFATFGIIFPSFVVIYIISMFLNDFLEIKIIANAFQGIEIAVALLILDAAISMVKKIKHKPLPMIIMLASFVGMLLINFFSWNFSSVNLLIIAAATNFCVCLFQNKGKAVQK